jgi:hypothetical protein
MAMSIGDVFDPSQVTYSNWVDMSHDCDLQIERFLALVLETAARVFHCTTSVAGLAKAEGWHVALFDKIVDVAKQRTKSITDELES